MCRERVLNPGDSWAAPDDSVSDLDCNWLHFSTDTLFPVDCLVALFNLGVFFLVEGVTANASSEMELSRQMKATSII